MGRNSDKGHAFIASPYQSFILLLFVIVQEIELSRRPLCCDLNSATAISDFFNDFG